MMADTQRYNTVREKAYLTGYSAQVGHGRTRDDERHTHTSDDWR